MGNQQKVTIESLKEWVETLEPQRVKPKVPAHATFVEQPTVQRSLPHKWQSFTPRPGRWNRDKP